MPFVHDAAVPFDLTVERQGSVATVAVVGELDLATAPRLSAVLGEHGDAEVLVADLTATTFIDSTGVRVLVEADRRCAGIGDAVRGAGRRRARASRPRALRPRSLDVRRLRQPRTARLTARRGRISWAPRES